MKTLLDLAKAMEKLQKEISTAANEAAVFVAETVVENLARVTPVDTSTAISGWVVSLVSQTAYKPGAHFYGSQGSTYTASVRETINNAKLVLRNKHPGQKIFIVNNEDYINDLNNGSSKQAPAGFVERAEALGRIAMRDYKLKLNLKV